MASKICRDSFSPTLSAYYLIGPTRLWGHPHPTPPPGKDFFPASGTVRVRLEE